MVRSKGIFADLHVHTWFSDSSMSPAQAVEEAVKYGVGVFAIADHEGFEGSREAEKLARDAGITFIPAGELECTQDGMQLHVLAYGADRDNAQLRRAAAENRRILDEMSEILIDRMKDDYPSLSRDEYADYVHDRSLGGWKGLHYLKYKGVTSEIREGMGLYAQYGVGYEDAGFGDLDAILSAIHGAGGKAVLAHPGHTLKNLSTDAMEKTVRGLLEHGLDGMECYYPLHTPEMTKMFLAVCREKDLLITAGSDCHGSFGHSRVGEMNIEAGLLRLDGLIGR